MPDAEKTAFVFAGGGSLGAIQVGMLHALVQAGLRPDFVVGRNVRSGQSVGPRRGGRPCTGQE